MNFPVLIYTKKVPHVSPRVNVYYPFVYHLKNSHVQWKINRDITNAFNQLLIDQNYYEPSLQEMNAYFEIKTNERNILSLNLIVYSFTGGAHGMTKIKSLTFDTRTGKQYTLNELFKANSNYVKKLSEIIGQKIQDWNIDLLDEFTGIKSDQDFYIADTSLVIYFQLYEITPYVYGFPYFPIPILDIAPIINPNGPLDRLMSFT